MALSTSGPSASDLDRRLLYSRISLGLGPNPTSRTVAFRLGIQSAQWAASKPVSWQSERGQTWDLILVNVMAAPTECLEYRQC
ncbi:MAG: hypothetical protein IPM81_20340 [Saprospirales bacterium]|nr:hypothetical protein [Saprospirales bacterium]